ncbi:conserved hypothetical protein [Talaromyces stipitatus ATCC 10500]|uniref:Uncharacterized protein n=1 Tax=Talaromyces stipitatus (strain ATCC 10500 / CBS 375.48 / QM 6759 / NRRL 1006) TaxID=441959 RepID=B8LUM5_TALSN|nr:uncharacterized protein TSTA_072720 [Talaromyces stipitatus ATCC 10500]EED23882.1 conserved hypothetical protein [Talaromyces stipitatus ATCC 10500]
MPVPDKKPSFFDKPNLFAHIYTTYASRVIQEYVASDRKDKINRTKIEKDIIRLTNEDPNLPILHKVSCTSMVLHTNTFEPFWADQRLAYSLPAKSLRRLTPQYNLIDELPCPSDDDTLSTLENFTDKKGKPRHKSAADTTARRGRGRPKAAPAKMNGKGKAGTGKAGTVAMKAPKSQAARPSQSGADNNKSKANGNNPNAPTTPVQAQPLRTASGKLISTKTARESFLECMAQGSSMKICGPSSDEESTTTDDDSDSEA